ncbi:glycosyltransferase family 2 protein [Vagococcus silagei]|uniref:Glycosyltransferase family 2 protein n=1 Tax=Vagococcus silagei TaxID=2508885 RepID=A0A4S3B3L7_9ENTE|nr:glycosyltransferase family 2 protein [Vagococcus silagei]THB60163.1 glycosyltransferase family 2 protein [Vagococcus silagei]
MNDTISIITAVYNSENYFEETITSVLKQTYEKWNWYIVDDCSSDGTEGIIKRYQDDKRIHYIKLESNKGAAEARNVGLKLAETDFIAFLDADDTWNELKLEKQLAFMKAKNYGFTFTAYQIMGKTKPIKVPKSLNYNQYMKNTIIGMLTVMINRSIVGDVSIVNVRKDHDSMTWAKLLRENISEAYGLNENLASYRKVEGSISNNKFEAVKNHWKNCRNLEKLSVFKTSYYFVFYGINAFLKHYK